MWLKAVMEHHKRLETCVGNLKDWCSSRRLQLNSDKTELICFGFRANLSKLKRLDVMSLTLCSVDLNQSTPSEILASFLIVRYQCRNTSATFLPFVSSTFAVYVSSVQCLSIVCSTSGIDFYCLVLTIATPCSPVY